VNTMPFLQPPSGVALTTGIGEASTSLNAFDAALQAAGIPNVSLCRVTSILPPDVEVCPLPSFPIGCVIPAVWAQKVSGQPGELISAAIALGFTLNGPTLLAEYSVAGAGREETRRQVLLRLAGMAESRQLRFRAEPVTKAVEHRVKKVGCVVALAAYIP